MSKCRAMFVLAVGIVVAPFSRAEGMCGAAEKVIFNCELQKATASLCESFDSVLSYRNGTSSKMILEVSDSGSLREKVFYFSNTPYAGGGESHVRFSRGGYTYYMYDKTVKTDDGPVSSAGVVVYQNDKKMGNLICNNDASIRQAGYRDIAREEYKDIDSK